MASVSKADGTRGVPAQSSRADGTRLSGVLETLELAGGPVVPYGLLIVSDIRFLREGLADVFLREPDFQVSGAARDLAEAVKMATAAAPDIILIDAALPEGPVIATRLRQCAPEPAWWPLPSSKRKPRSSPGRGPA